jgi:hypothetical protein
MCLTCQLVTDPATPGQQELPPSGRTWPWIVVGLVVVGGATGAFLWARARSERQSTEARYPLVADPAQQPILEMEAKQWRSGRKAVRATLAAFEPPPIAESEKPCPLSFAIPKIGASMDEQLSSASVRHPEDDLVLAYELAPGVAEHVAAQTSVLLRTAKRGRFGTARGRYLSLAALSLPVIVMKLDENKRPAVTQDDMVVAGVNMGPRKGFLPGRRAGIAYVFDEQTGKLACVGRFEATSSESVETVQGAWGSGSENDAIEIDFETNTIAAIAKAVHAVE